MLFDFIYESASSACSRTISRIFYSYARHRQNRKPNTYSLFSFATTATPRGISARRYCTETHLTFICILWAICYGNSGAKKFACCVTRRSLFTMYDHSLRPATTRWKMEKIARHRSNVLRVRGTESKSSNRFHVAILLYSNFVVAQKTIAQVYYQRTTV